MTGRCKYSPGVTSVSYTHLDVYKRQPKICRTGLFHTVQKIPEGGTET